MNAHERGPDRKGIKGTSYTIGELAAEFGISTRAIRFYEAEGLLAPLRQGSKRLYRRRDRTRLTLILRGKRLGFTLSEIRDTFELYDQAHGERKQLHYYLRMLEEKRRQLQQQRQDIDQALLELEDSYQHCQKLLAQQLATEE
jgi:DNA-binding transcriptional MerR regulator